MCAWAMPVSETCASRSFGREPDRPVEVRQRLRRGCRSAGARSPARDHAPSGGSDWPRRRLQDRHSPGVLPRGLEQVQPAVRQHRRVPAGALQRPARQVDAGAPVVGPSGRQPMAAGARSAQTAWESSSALSGSSASARVSSAYASAFSVAVCLLILARPAGRCRRPRRSPAVRGRALDFRHLDLRPDDHRHVGGDPILEREDVGRRAVVQCSAQRWALAAISIQKVGS